MKCLLFLEKLFIYCYYLGIIYFYFSFSFYCQLISFNALFKLVASAFLIDFKFFIAELLKKLKLGEFYIN